MKRQRKEPPPLRCQRNTRAKIRKVEAAKQTFAEEHFVKSPVLQGLSIAFKSGYLYRNDCRAVALTCRNWLSVWEGDKDKLPEFALVPIITESSPQVIEDRGIRNKFDDSGHPLLLNEMGLTEDIFSSYNFIRLIFEKILILRKQMKPRATQVHWTKDIKSVFLFKLDNRVLIQFKSAARRGSTIYCILKACDGKLYLDNALSTFGKGSKRIDWQYNSWELLEADRVTFWPLEEVLSSDSDE